MSKREQLPSVNPCISLSHYITYVAPKYNHLLLRETTSFIHASWVHPFVLHLRHWFRMLKSHSLCYEMGCWSTCGETLVLCITFLEQVWTLECQTLIQLLVFAKQPYQLNSLCVCVCAWMKLVKEEDIEDVIIGNIVIIVFVVHSWCGVICKYFRRCTQAYKGIGRVLYTY